MALENASHCGYLGRSVLSSFLVYLLKILWPMYDLIPSCSLFWLSTMKGPLRKLTQPPWGIWVVHSCESLPSDLALHLYFLGDFQVVPNSGAVALDNDRCSLEFVAFLTIYIGGQKYKAKQCLLPVVVRYGKRLALSGSVCRSAKAQKGMRKWRVRLLEHRWHSLKSAGYTRDGSGQPVTPENSVSKKHWRRKQGKGIQEGIVAKYSSLQLACCWHLTPCNKKRTRALADSDTSKPLPCSSLAPSRHLPTLRHASTIEWRLPFVDSYKPHSHPPDFSRVPMRSLAQW